MVQGGAGKGGESRSSRVWEKVENRGESGGGLPHLFPNGGPLEGWRLKGGKRVEKGGARKLF